jgi:hypothetical protein
MILSSATLRFLALASLAVSATSNTIRGSPQDAQDNEAASIHRDLLSFPNPNPNVANVGLGQMVCEENALFDDGSVTCVFRAIPPTDSNSATLLYDCMYSSKGNLCLSTQLSLVPFNEVPNNGGGIVVVPNTGGGDLTPPVPPEELSPPPGGTCPATRPLTGFGCRQYISSESERTVCLYDDFRCTCSLESSPLAWDCYRVIAPVQDPTSPPAPTFPPTSGPLSTPTPPPTSSPIAPSIATMPPFVPPAAVAPTPTTVTVDVVSFDKRI